MHIKKLNLLQPEVTTVFPVHFLCFWKQYHLTFEVSISTWNIRKDSHKIKYYELNLSTVKSNTVESENLLLVSHTCMTFEAFCMTLQNWNCLHQSIKRHLKLVLTHTSVHRGTLSILIKSQNRKSVVHVCFLHVYLWGHNFCAHVREFIFCRFFVFLFFPNFIQLCCFSFLVDFTWLYLFISHLLNFFPGRWRDSIDSNQCYHDQKGNIT